MFNLPNLHLFPSPNPRRIRRRRRRAIAEGHPKLLGLCLGSRLRPEQTRRGGGTDQRGVHDGSKCKYGSPRVSEIGLEEHDIIH